MRATQVIVELNIILSIVIARLVRATQFLFFEKVKMGHPDKPGDDGVWFG
jgi:hypothetical protein